MATKAYALIALTGGGTGALDAIDGAALVDGDQAYVVDATANTVYEYTLNSTSAAAASSPTIISPTANAGDKRWELCKSYVKDSITFNDGTNIGLVQFTANVLELYSQRHSGVVRISVEDGAGNKETAATFTGGGSVNLYYDNSVKLATTSTGVTITGTALSDNFTDASGYTIPYRRNALINGNFIIGQRGTSFTSATTPANSDDTYLLDRWIILSDGNDIVDVTQTTTVPTTLFKNSIGLDVETTNKKFGILQVIENQNCYHMIGRTVTFSFWAKVSDATKLDNVKAAIISWDSTADTVTSDVVNAWENEGTEPTLAANWTYENTPANLGVTTSWVKYTVSAAVDTASTANIAVFIWSDVTDTTAGHFLYITGCQLEVGPVATDFEFRQISDELILCQRYYEKSYNIADIPGTATATAVIYQVCAAYGTTAIDPGPFVFYKVRKRIAVNPTFYNHVTGSSGSARGGPAGAPQNCNPVLVGASENGFGSYFNTLVGLTDATAVAGWFHFVCDAEL